MTSKTLKDPWKKWRFIPLIGGPAGFAVCMALVPEGETGIMVKMLAVAIWMLIWWLTEVVSISVTALLPLILIPALGILPLTTISSLYTHPIVFLFFGGFLLALGIEKWNLHRRIALNILLKTGSRPRNVLLGILLATGLLSMWISNTATAVMMFPIALSIAAIYRQKYEASESSPFQLIFLLAVAYGANIGGIATLIGTPPNLILAGFYHDTFNRDISFIAWFSIGFPLSIILGAAVFYYMGRFLPDNESDSAQEEFIRSELAVLGKISVAEKRFLVVFCLTALAWMIRPQLAEILPFEEFTDTTVALIGGLMLFIIPSGNEHDPVLLQWSDTVKLPWGILLLFGGGLSLASGLQHTGIVSLMGQYIIGFDMGTMLIIIALVTIVGVFATELISNMALVAAMMAVIVVIGETLNIPFLILAVPLTIGASCAFMLPMATPPNAIVFGGGGIRIRQMAAIGIVLNVLAVLLISLFVFTISPYILSW